MSVLLPHCVSELHSKQSELHTLFIIVALWKVLKSGCTSLPTLFLSKIVLAIPFILFSILESTGIFIGITLDP